MAEQEWLKGYAGQSTGELLALEGVYRTDSIVTAFEDGLLQKAHAFGGNALSFAEKVILAVEALEREVNNGGYELLFENQSNEYALIIVEALQKIGCPKTAEITQRAIDINRTGACLSLEECDNAFFASAENIAEQLFGYIKQNIDGVVL